MTTPTTRLFDRRDDQPISDDQPAVITVDDDRSTTHTDDADSRSTEAVEPAINTAARPF